MSVVIDGIKSIVWVLVLLIIAYFIMNLMGYQINNEYFTYTKKQCQQKLKDCTDSLIHKGIDNAECNVNCIEPKLIIKKK